MIEQETINRLLIDEDYYGSFGKQYLSNSDIGSLLNNPKDFRKPQPDNINFHKGRYFHQLNLIKLQKQILLMYLHELQKLIKKLLQIVSKIL